MWVLLMIFVGRRRDLSEEAVTCVLRLAKLQLLGHTREDNEQVPHTCPYTQAHVVTRHLRSCLLSDVSSGWVCLASLTRL